MSDQVRILSFYENWRDLKKMFTNDEWCELEEIIWALRFDGIDTDPKTISNMKIRMAWNLIRPSIKKSNRNSRYQEKKKADITTNSEFDNTATTDISKPQYSEDLNRLLNNTEDIEEINKVLENAVNYEITHREEYESFYKQGNYIINKIVAQYNLSEASVKDLEKYALEYRTRYYNNIIDNDYGYEQLRNTRNNDYSTDCRVERDY